MAKTRKKELENVDIIIYGDGFQYAKKDDEKQAAQNSKDDLWRPSSEDFRSTINHMPSKNVIRVPARSFDKKFFKLFEQRLKSVKTFKRLLIIGHGNEYGLYFSGKIQPGLVSDLKGTKPIDSESLKNLPKSLLEALRTKGKNGRIILYACKGGLSISTSREEILVNTVVKNIGITTVSLRHLADYCFRAKGKVQKWPIVERGWTKPLEPRTLIKPSEGHSLDQPADDDKSCEERGYRKDIFNLLEEVEKSDAAKDPTERTLNIVVPTQK